MLRKKILVLGGSGYIGQQICKAATKYGPEVEVQSFSRSGLPSPESQSPSHEWMNKVTWLKGDIGSPEALHDAIDQNTIIISTIGAFGSNAFMKQICGQANVEAIRLAAKVETVSRFIFISSANAASYPFQSDTAPMAGYFQGKRDAEHAMQRYFPTSGFCLRPGFVYGKRSIPSPFDSKSQILLPLDLVGKPLEFFGNKAGLLSSGLQHIPFFGKEISSTIAVKDVARAAVHCALNPLNQLTSLESSSGIFEASAIRKLAALV